MARGVNGHRAIGAATATKSWRSTAPIAGPLAPYAGTVLRHVYIPLPFVIGMCQQCFGWCDDHRHTTRKG